LDTGDRRKSGNAILAISSCDFVAATFCRDFGGCDIVAIFEKE
jgi:hypothetical protein